MNCGCGNLTMEPDGICGACKANARETDRTYRQPALSTETAKCDRCERRVTPASMLIPHEGKKLCPGCIEKIRAKQPLAEDAGAGDMTQSPEIGDRVAERPQPQHAPTSLKEIADKYAKDGGSTQPPTEGGEMSPRGGARKPKSKKECLDCHKQFMPSGMNQKRCDPCKAKAKPPTTQKQPKAPRTPKPAASRQTPAPAPAAAPKKSTGGRKQGWIERRDNWLRKQCESCSKGSGGPSFGLTQLANSGHSAVLAALKKDAAENFRTPEMQALFVLSEHYTGAAK